MEPELRRLVDEHDIRKLVIAFSNGMDARDVAMFRSAFADEVDLDIPPRAADVIVLQGKVDADVYAEQVIRLLSGFEATQHVSTNHQIEVDGDRATCACYTHATHYLPHEGGHPWLTAGSRYALEARRFPGEGWRFVKFRSTRMFSDGNLGLWDELNRRLTQQG
jgi:hypothetical protein